MRKKIVLISLIVGFCFFGVLCYKSWIITFVITKCLSGRTDDKQGIVRSIIIPWRNYQLHLHHWFLALVIGGVFVVRGFYILHRRSLTASSPPLSSRESTTTKTGTES